MNGMEEVVLLDEKYQPIGTAAKSSVHAADTPLHLAFSCYIFNKNGEILVTKRAATKKVWPGYWTNSVCGHPAPGESMEEAIRRRAAFELGLEVSDLSCVLPDYRYKTPPDNGIIENEFCPVYVARTDQQPKPNPEEVDEFKWLTWGDFLKDVGQQKKDYSYWCKDQLNHLKDNNELSKYIN